MDAGTFPFPLAAHSSHHSHYHRFLLGADPSVLSPFPKPFCVGALAGSMRRLTDELSLPGWRKLFHGAIPWVDGFGPEHYDLGALPAHRPLPQGYGRPLRRFGAFDFVQVADPSVSALALVAGDRRIIDRFVFLGNEFCTRLEPGLYARSGPSGTRNTGRMLAGQFVEPNNRWLMPFLHVHTRVLNLTSGGDAPRRLACVDHAALARAGERARQGWVARQAEALSDLGYGVALAGVHPPTLRVDGVSSRLLAAMEAPRIAVLRLLERIVLGDRDPAPARFAAEMPAAVIAAMVEQLESVLARSLSCYKPPKIGLPSEGPWRGAVREYMGRTCPRELALLDGAASRARAIPCGGAIFPAPPLDAAHRHAPAIEEIAAGFQLPGDPELSAGRAPDAAGRVASAWLAREFEATLRQVNDRLVRAGPADPLVSLRDLLPGIDQLSQSAGEDQLRQSATLLGEELDRRADPPSCEVARPGWPDRGSLVPLDALLEGWALAPCAREREIGGRSL